MSNLVEEWKKRAREKYGTITKGVEHLNMICNRKIRVADISAMSRGERAIHPCIYNLMLSDVLVIVLERSGFKNDMATDDINDFMELVDTLSPPQRVRK